MTTPGTRFITLAGIAAAALLASSTLLPSAAATPLEGVVVDAWTETPLAGAQVEVTQLQLFATTSADGSFTVDIPDDADAMMPTEGWTVHLVHTSDSAEAELTYVGQRPDRTNVLRMYAADVAMSEVTEWGAPMSSRPPSAEGVPVRLDEWLSNGPLLATLPASLPETVRVGRRFASSCRDAEVSRIDEVPFEEYVQGVLVPEIGVFKAVAGGPDSAMAVFEAFAIAARTYALWFYLQDPDATYHLDDTACNQRYEGARDAFIATAVANTAGQVLVRASDEVTIDKFEYAASCGRHGSEPEYQTTLVPDVTNTEACVGSWCGHNGCAAHEDNPAVPGDDRCLVRGICQWGAVERSMRGDTYVEILNHYQPNLAIVDIGGPPATELVGYVRIGEISAGEAVQDVTVTLDTGEAATTDAGGFFEFEDIPDGVRTLSFAGGGIVPIARDKDVIAGITNWASIAVEWDVTGEDTGSGDVGVDDVSIDDVGVDDAGPDDVAGEDVGVADTADTDLADTNTADTRAPDTGNDSDNDDSNSSDDSDLSDGSGENPTPRSAIPAFSSVEFAQPAGCGCTTSSAPNRSLPFGACVALGAIILRRRR